MRRGVVKIVIVARERGKLDRTVEEPRGISADVEVHTIAIDLSEHDAAASIRSNVDAVGWPIEILVNNAGLARKYVFAKDPEHDPSLRMVDTMVRAVVDLLLKFLPNMVERRRGGIINIGSPAAFSSVP